MKAVIVVSVFQSGFPALLWDMHVRFNSSRNCDMDFHKKKIKAINTNHVSDL